VQDNPLLCIICGYECSGTTLVSELVRQHPGVDGRFECGFLLVEKMTEFIDLEPYASNLKRDWGVTQESLEYICQAPTWLDAYCRLRERAAIPSRNVQLYDKTPLYLRDLQAVLGKADVPSAKPARLPPFRPSNSPLTKL
jgi:hypothetical protein